jgi:hypothetical protein
MQKGGRVRSQQCLKSWLHGIRSASGNRTARGVVDEGGILPLVLAFESEKREPAARLQKTKSLRVARETPQLGF